MAPLFAKHEVVSSDGPNRHGPIRILRGLTTGPGMELHRQYHIIFLDPKLRTKVETKRFFLLGQRSILQAKNLPHPDAYCPYHRVVDGTPYQAVLLMTGDNDHRVNPSNSRKMMARLQATTSSREPILLRTSSAVGHGIDTALDEAILEDADVFAFLFNQVGAEYRPAQTRHVS